jgi:hypothetical protein
MKRYKQQPRGWKSGRLNNRWSQDTLAVDAPKAFVSPLPCQDTHLPGRPAMNATNPVTPRYSSDAAKASNPTLVAQNDVLVHGCGVCRSSGARRQRTQAFCGAD